MDLFEKQGPRESSMQPSSRLYSRHAKEPPMCHDVYHRLNLTGRIANSNVFTPAQVQERFFRSALEKPSGSTGTVPIHLDQTYTKYANGSDSIHFGYWPLQWAWTEPLLYPTNVYNQTKCRPGGESKTLYFEDPRVDASFSPFDPAVYALHGDSASVEQVARNISSECKAVLPMNSTSQSLPATSFVLSPRNALAYYREGSFSIHQNGYDNSRSLEQSAEPGQWYDLSGNPGLYSDTENVFGQCVHRAVLDHLPIGSFEGVRGYQNSGAIMAPSTSPMLASLTFFLTLLMLFR